MIGQHLIDMVDEAGYLSAICDAVAEKLGADMAEVEAVLAVLQGFDPAASAHAISPNASRSSSRSATATIPPWRRCSARLDLLAKRDFAALRKICGVGDEDLTDMIAEIKQLNPKPGLAFGSATVQPIVPDVFVRAAPDGSFHCRTELRHAAENSAEPDLSCARLEDGGGVIGQGLSRREAAIGDLAHPRARSARAHDPESVGRDREAAGCASSRTASSICVRSI